MSVKEFLQTLEVLDRQAIFPSLDTTFSKCYSRANFAAPGQDVPTIREIVSQRREQLNDIGALIERVETILTQLRQKREQIVSSMRMHEGFISCLRRLPLEILKEIFLQCLPKRAPISPDKRTAPLLLTWICRSWRELAFDTPRLWCSLTLTEPRRDPVHQFGSYRDWLKNAKGLPLSLTVDISNTHLSRHSGWGDMAVEFTRLYTSRATELSVSFDEVSHLYSLLKDIPILERLRLDGDMAMMSSTKPLSIIQPHPSLRTFILYSLPFNINLLGVFNPGWTNLTRLAVVIQLTPQLAVDDFIFLTFLQTCPNLEQFVCSPVRFPERHNPISFTHPKLCSLDIASFHANDLDVDSVRLPSLRNLQLRRSDRHKPVSMEDTFVHEQARLDGDRTLGIHATDWVNLFRSYKLFTVFDLEWANIRHLSLYVEGIEDILFVLLQRCPNVEDIVCSIDVVRRNRGYISASHAVLRSMSVVIRNGLFGVLLDTLNLPGLCHLDISLSGKLKWPHEQFKAFVSRSHCPLETLTIKVRTIPTEEEREELVTMIPTLRRLDLYDTKVRFEDVWAGFYDTEECLPGALVYSWTR